MKTIYSLIATFLLIGLIGNGVSAQKTVKPWSEWSEREAQKLLDDSAWGKTEENAYRSAAPLLIDLRNTDQFGLISALESKYHVRLLSAQPIRQAFARKIELGKKNPTPELKQQLTSFVDRKFDEWIVIAVDYEPSERGNPGALSQAFVDTNTDRLKNVTYLETKGGQRLMLQEYKAPTSDGLGAKFIFPRMLNGKPFLAADSVDLRFHTEISKFIHVRARFKISEMMHNGALEY